MSGIMPRVTELVAWAQVGAYGKGSLAGHGSFLRLTVLRTKPLLEQLLQPGMRCLGWKIGRAAHHATRDRQRSSRLGLSSGGGCHR